MANKLSLTPKEMWPSLELVNYLLLHHDFMISMSVTLKIVYPITSLQRQDSILLPHAAV